MQPKMILFGVFGRAMSLLFDPRIISFLYKSGYSCKSGAKWLERRHSLCVEEAHVDDAVFQETFFGNRGMCINSMLGINLTNTNASLMLGRN